VLLGTLHPLTDLSNVGEDGLLVAFTETLRRGDLVASCAGACEVGMCAVEECEEAVEQEVVGDGCGGVVLPDAGALDHVALLDFRLGGGCFLFAVGLFATSGCELGLEVILDLLLAGLLLLLERGEVVFSGLLVAVLLLLGRLLLLLSWY
jgi:hypothetical protein